MIRWVPQHPLTLQLANRNVHNIFSPLFLVVADSRRCHTDKPTSQSVVSYGSITKLTSQSTVRFGPIAKLTGQSAVRFGPIAKLTSQSAVRYGPIAKLTSQSAVRYS